jgi:hypothetical protein
VARPSDVDKLYVSNIGALTAKYGADAQQISDALDALVQADAGRGLTSYVAYLDVPEGQMTPVSSPDDHVETKVAIDEWFVLCAPDYLVIVGGIDIVCMHPLANPMDDDDAEVPSDLPYSCSAQTSPSIARFVAPDRIVGRIPDLTGTADAGLFVALLRSAAAPVSIAPPAPDTVFAVAAQKWEAAGQNLLDIGQVWPMSLHTTPPVGPDWPPDDLHRSWHVLSCHGAPGTPAFFGEDLAGHYPEAVEADRLEGEIAPGTVCVTGSCYGAELYPPSVTNTGVGIPFAYLGQGAAAFTGSTTIAYGNDDYAYGCDELCGYLLSFYLDGGSAGRALLEARLRFVGAHPDLAPEEQKTLAQFVLYGDPERHFFTPPPADPDGARVERREIRAGLLAEAHRVEATTRPALARSTPSARALGGANVRLNADEPLVSELLARGFEESSVSTFSVGLSAASRGRALALAGNLETADGDPEGAVRVRSMAVALRRVDAETPTRVWEGLRLSEHSDGTISEQRFWSH